MDNHQWRLSHAYTYALYISKHISITLIPYHLIFLLHVNLFLFHVLCLWHILYLYFLCILISILYIFLYLSCVHLFPGCHMSFSSFSSMTYYILCTITYIISYPIPISCLLSCCGYTPLLYFSFTFLFSLLSVLYLFISFLCTILCTFYIL